MQVNILPVPSEPIGSHFSKTIPALQTALDATSISLFKECPRKYYYKQVLGWERQNNEHHLIFGQHIHSALEFFDHKMAEGMDRESAIRATVRYTLEISGERNPDGSFVPWRSLDPKNQKTRESLVRTVVWYLEQFNPDVFETLILKNGKPAVELSFKVDTQLPAPDGEHYIISGHLDRVVRYADQLWVVDRKTTGSALTSYFFDGFNPNTQMSLYSCVSTLVLGEACAGVIIDAAQILVDSTRFQRGFSPRTATQRDEFWEGLLNQTIPAIERAAETQRWPMNETACGNYGGCPFREVCSADPSVREKILQTRFTKKIWNPLENRGGND